MHELKYITTCIICGADRFHYIHKDTELIRANDPCCIVKCETCGFKFLNPQRVNIYDKGYFDEYKEKSNVCGGSGILENFLKKRLIEAEGLVGSKRLLEIGFAKGLFLDFARKRGWEVYGIDISEWAVDTARERFGLLNLYAGSLLDIKLEDSFFDIIHMNHVLEHIPDIKNFLIELRRILRPGGLLIVEVPNEFDTLQEILRELIGIKRVGYEVPSPHLWFFTPKTLKRLFLNAEFSIFRLKTSRRNKEMCSKYKGGVILKQFIYILEDYLHKGPLIELWATKKAKGIN